MPVSAGYVNTCLNPWVETPSGVADEFSMPTSTLKFRSSHTVTPTSTGGHIMVGFQPWAAAVASGVGPSFLNYATGFTGTTSVIATYGNDYHPDVATMTTNFDRLRCVSCGVKVYYTGSEQATSGVLSIIPVVSTVMGLATMPTDIAAWTNMPGAKTVAAASMTEPLCGAFHAFDRPQFHFATDVTGQARFPSFAVIGLGLEVSKACVRIEVELNLEVLPKLITPINANQFNPQAYNQGALNITRRLDSTRVGTLGQVTNLKASTIGSGAVGSTRKAGKGLSGGTYKRKRSAYKKTGMRKRRGMKKRRTTRR